MALHRHVTVTFQATCDVRVDTAGAVVTPTSEQWAAYQPGMAADDPVVLALGRACHAWSGDVEVKTAAQGRRSLTEAGWEFVASRGEHSGRHMGWRAACPKHVGML